MPLQRLSLGVTYEMLNIGVLEILLEVDLDGSTVLTQYEPR